MRARKATAKPTPGQTDAWVMLGYLQGAIEDEGRITVEDWNAAARAGDELAIRLASRRASISGE